MAASLAACLKAHGKAQTEADVNLVMGAGAMRGATWEDLTAAAQYFGLRSTLVVPSTVNQLREWTDRGTPVVIAYNPEGRPWSHASVVFDVTGEGSDTMVHIMDPNIPDPDETVRVMPKSAFYKVWGEPLGEKMIVRRPACAIEREVTPEGRQVMASKKPEADLFRAAALQASEERVAGKYLESKGKQRTTEVREKKDKSKLKVKVPLGGNPHAENALSRKTTRGHNRKERPHAVSKGHSRKPKHKKRLDAGAQGITMKSSTKQVGVSPSRVALRFAVSKNAVSGLKLLADAFRPFREFISADPRTWGNFLKRAKQDLEMAVSAADLDVDSVVSLETTSIEVQGPIADKGDRWTPPDYDTIEIVYPDKFSVEGSADFPIHYEVSRLGKYAEDKRGFRDAFKKVTYRQLKPLIKFLEYTVLEDFSVDQVVELSAVQLDEVIEAEQKSEHDIELSSWDWEDATIDGIDFDHTDGSKSTLVWNWVVLVKAAHVSAPEFDNQGWEEGLLDDEADRRMDERDEGDEW